MIAPEFRNQDSMYVTSPVQTFVSFNYGMYFNIEFLLVLTYANLLQIGDSLWNDLSGDIQQVEMTYQQLGAAHQHKTNPAQLEKF